MAGTRHVARPEPEYGASEISAGAQGNFGNHIIKPGLNVQVKKPSWSGTETVFRPFPSVCHLRPDEFWPYRIDPEGGARFGHCIRRYPCAWGTGSPGVTFLLGDPAADRTFDPWGTPLGILYGAIEKACKAGQGRPEWYPLREGSTGRGKALKAPTDVYLMQGVMLKHNDKPTFDNKRAPWGWGANPTLVLMLSSGLGANLVAQLNLENENFHGDPRDFEARYVNGDPFGLENGRYLHFFEKGHDPREKYQARPTGQTPDPLAATGSWASQVKTSGGDDPRGFDLRITKTYGGTTDDDGASARFNDPDRVKIIREKWHHWEDILFFPTVEEQVRMLAKAFPPSAIMYAFSGTYDSWIPDDIRKNAVAAASASVPAQPPPAASPFGGPAVNPMGAANATASAGSPSGWPAAAPGGAQGVGNTSMFPTESTPVVQDTVVPGGEIPGDVPPGLAFAAAPPVTGGAQNAAAKIAQLAAARKKAAAG